ncbi:MAG TPA: pyruvate/oxaloacetate carboxyltransferase [Clostridia bacterium]|nr:pyruvate/oxaloacetate carboxyltransferase [Clostridia bacterium]
MVRITDTTLRDGHQSLIATRMRTRDMLPILEKLDEVGFYSLEVWGGATFDAAMRYLNEDPWDRLSAIRERVKKTPLQMLLRGQNLVGYRHYADDVVERFVKKAVANGIDIIRVFDALNDIRNLEVAIKSGLDAGAHVQGAICYTISPVHTTDLFVEMALQLEEMGCQSICVKDMAGLITPKAARDLIGALKRNLSVPVDLHTHCTSGVGPLSYLSAYEAGVDILDCAFSPFAGGTSQPAVETMVAALPEETGLDLRKLVEIGYYFNALREKYKGLISPVSERPDVTVLLHQIPGGMISNLYSQLEKQKALDRYEEVLKEVPRVRKDLGYPPLVTPTSQIVGTQAVFNVLAGERYRDITKEVKDYCLGYYGKVCGPIDPTLWAKVSEEGRPPITCRPADLLEPELERLKAEAQEAAILTREEDLLTYALYPELAVKFFRGEIQEESLPAPPRPLDGKAESLPMAEFVVNVDGEDFHVRIRPGVNGGFGIPELDALTKRRPGAEGRSAEERINDMRSRKVELPKGAVTTPVGGMILSLKVKVGDRVKEGETVAIVEAMKMQVSVTAKESGKVKEVYTYEGEVVDSGDILMLVG